MKTVINLQVHLYALNREASHGRTHGLPPFSDYKRQ